MIKALLIIGCGGFIGSVCRYLLQQYFNQNFSAEYPWGTLTANLVGCFFIGLIFGYALHKTNVPYEFVWFFATGFCGAFTTFSTFSYESLHLLKHGKAFVALAYLSISVIAGLVLTWTGMYLAKWLG